MRWFRRRGKDADQSPSGMTDFTTATDVFTAPMAEGFEESFVPGVCDICGTSSSVFRCRFCEDEGVKRSVQACWACWRGPIWESGNSHAAIQHPYSRYIFHALSVRFTTEDFVREEVEKCLLGECANATENGEDTKAIVAMAEPNVEHYVDAAAEAASQAIYKARISAHWAVAAFREGRDGTPGEEAARTLAIPTDFAVYTDATGTSTAPVANTPPHPTSPYPVAAVCELCGANVGNGLVKPCSFCEREGVNPPLKVCNACWVGPIWEAEDSHVATKHLHDRYAFHVVNVQLLQGYWLRDQVQQSLSAECSMFTENDEDARRCIAIAAPGLANHIGASADAAGNAIFQARSAAHEAIAAFRKTRTGS